MCVCLFVRDVCAKWILLLVFCFSSFFLVCESVRLSVAGGSMSCMSLCFC